MLAPEILRRYFSCKGAHDDQDGRVQIEEEKEMKKVWIGGRQKENSDGTDEAESADQSVKLLACWGYSSTLSIRKNKAVTIFKDRIHMHVKSVVSHIST